MRAVIGAVAGALTLAAEPLAAGEAIGGTITDVAVTFTRTAYGNDPTVSFKGAGNTATQNFLFDAGWWYRIPGDTRETSLKNPTIESWAPGDDATATWTNVDARNLFGVELYQKVNDVAADLGHPAGSLFQVLTVHNLSGAPLTLELFGYVDADVALAPSDSAVWSESTPSFLIDLTDAGGEIAQVVSNFAQSLPVADTRFLIAPWPGVKNLLNDASVTNFSNAGAPFGPGDFTTAFQYHLEIAANGARAVHLYYFVNYLAHCGALNGIFCDGFETNGLHLWALPPG